MSACSVFSLPHISRSWCWRSWQPQNGTECRPKKKKKKAPAMKKKPSLSSQRSSKGMCSLAKQKSFRQKHSTPVAIIYPQQRLNEEPRLLLLLGSSEVSPHTLSMQLGCQRRWGRELQAAKSQPLLLYIIKETEFLLLSSNNEHSLPFREPERGPVGKPEFFLPLGTNEIVLPPPLLTQRPTKTDLNKIQCLVT